MAARRSTGDPTIVVVLLVCVAVGMVQGARGLVRGASSGFERTSAVQAQRADAAEGTLRVSSSACRDTPGLDVVRYRATDSRGREVARVEQPLDASRTRQSAELGRHLPPGRYTVTCTCLSDGRQVGEQTSTRVSIGGGRDGHGAGRPSQLPHTGR